MSDNSKIEWTDATWNPVTGCTKISPGCKNCYAERFAERWRGIPGHAYEQGFDLKLWPERLKQPLAWKRPRIIFVNSMSDLFHAEVPLSFIQQVFETMGEASQHTFQILTKRAERLEELAPLINWPANVWMGVSVENQDYAWRVDHLRTVPAAIRFLSVEPLLGPVDLDLTNIDWVIVGGESGPAPGPWTFNGSAMFTNNAKRRRSPSSSNSGAAFRRKNQGELLTVVLGMSYQSGRNPDGR